MRNILNCAEQVQIQKYKTHAYMTPKTACVQTIKPKHATKQFRWVSKTKKQTNKQTNKKTVPIKPKYCINVSIYTILTNNKRYFKF